MRNRKAGIFLMALALAMPTALPTVVLARRSLRRSRFLATGGSCSDELPCPDITDSYGFPYPGAECCNGICVDTAFNAQHCGGCGYGYSCGSWPWICCYGYCFNSQNDFENCGRCGNFGDGRCSNGVCDYAV